jgi:hypothetical protein
LILYLSDGFMAYEYSYTGQIPHTCLDLACLLVKNDGTPLGEPFILSEFEDRVVSQLAESIKGRRSDIPSGVLPDFIKLWKPDPPLVSPTTSFGTSERRECAAFESRRKRTQCDGAAQDLPTSPFIHSKPVTGRPNQCHSPAPIGQGERRR